ncbi:hypothetical protein D3C86_2140460 [compost metagenome]
MCLPICVIRQASLDDHSGLSMKLNEFTQFLMDTAIRDDAPRSLCSEGHCDTPVDLHAFVG